MAGGFDAGHDGGRGGRGLDGFDDDRIRADDDPDRTAECLLLGHDPGRQDRESGHVEEAEPDADAGEVVRVVATEQAAARDGAHLVVQLRPADASAAVAEPDEFDRRPGPGLAVAALRGSIDGMPPFRSNGAR